jgi:type II secretory pathway component PulM
MTSWKRIAAENRGFILPIVVVILVNAGIYLAVVFPLGHQVSSLQAQSQQVHDALDRARQEYQGARTTAQGMVLADASLSKFYKDVLPVNASSAQRITYLRLAQLARDANVRLERGDNSVEKAKGSDLAKLSTSYTLSGDYRDVRRFIYSLETAPEFLVLENVALRSQEQGGRGLSVAIAVATYFRAEHGN